MSAPVSAARILRFDSFELDLQAGELRKRGIRLRLQGQPVQVLGILLQSAGNLVTREELRSQLWSADTFVDFDHSLHNAVARIREVLGDSADTPKYIETLPRRGYRFIGRIEEVAAPWTEPENSLARVPPAALAKPPAPGSRFLVTLAACAVLGLAAWMTWQHFSAKGAAPVIHSLAVLPLQNFSGDPAQEYFADGMTEELITELSRIHAIKVISRTSIMEYKGTKKHLPQIARELGVDGILEGSVRREGDQVRITVQLLDGPNDRHVWSEDYQREMRGILDLQRDMAQAIARQIRIEVTPQQQARANSGRAVNPEAYEAYLRGRSYITSAPLTPQDLKTAQPYFEEAIRKDPSFALGYVGLADCFVYLAIFHQISPASAVGPARAALRQAMELDDGIGEAHATLAMLDWLQDWDWAGAEREFDTAIALAPSFGCAHLVRGYFLAWQGQRSEALAEIARSGQLDPGYSFAASESKVHLLARDYDGLLTASRKELAANPKEWFGHYFLATAYEGTGRRSEAIPEYQKAFEMSNDAQYALAALGHAYAATGRRAEAENILQELEQKAKGEFVSPYLIATVHAGLGDKDQAFVFLEKAYAEKSWDLALELQSDLRIDNLRSDPRFRDLSRRLNFPREP
jgi:TolB-like protein/DNA-binding winged helix-turn-helix (wHTH) protein/Tfp pilus assembly protein PilF